MKLLLISLLSSSIFANCNLPLTSKVLVEQASVDYTLDSNTYFEANKVLQISEIVTNDEGEKNLYMSESLKDFRDFDGEFHRLTINNIEYDFIRYFPRNTEVGALFLSNSLVLVAESEDGYIKCSESPEKNATIFDALGSDQSKELSLEIIEFHGCGEYDPYVVGDICMYTASDEEGVVYKQLTFEGHEHSGFEPGDIVEVVAIKAYFDGEEFLAARML